MSAQAISWSENCTCGTRGTFTYSRFGAEKPPRSRSKSPAMSSSLSAPFMVVLPLSSISLFVSFNAVYVMERKTPAMKPVLVKETETAKAKTAAEIGRAHV